MTAVRIFAAPPRYVQGPGALDLLGRELRALGSRPALVCDAGLVLALQPRLLRSLEASGLPGQVLPFEGEVTLAAMDRVAEQVRAAGADVVAGIGGGRVLDAAKGAARRCGTAFVSVPTIAATDAAASRGIVVHDADGAVVAVEQLDRSPASVIVDTALIAAAPARYLRAGIGDAIAKEVELETCLAQGVLNKHGTGPLRASLAMARECQRLLRRHGPAALAAAERSEPTADLEAVVEAVLLLSCMAFENGGLSLAHAVAQALGAHPATRGALHGEHVAYATLVEMTFENRPEAEIRELARFLHSLGLPTSLAQLGLAEHGGDGILGLALTCCAVPHLGARARAVEPEALADALERTERRACEIDLAYGCPV